MKCPNCNKNVSELDEDCPNCGINFEDYEKRKKFEQDETENTDESNKTIFIKIINYIQLIGCIIGAIVLWANEETLIGFIILFSGIVLFAFIRGFSDIIELLDSINNKLKK